MKISIVVPVYNTPPEAFSRCLRSILSQTHPDFETIVIDDGSQDSLSPQYEALCALDSRVRYLKTENRGVSHARNTGIRVASGDYIAFVDADDTVSENFLAEAAGLAAGYNADAVIGRIAHYPPKPLEQSVPELTVEEQPRKVLEYIFFTDENPPYRIIGSSCGRIYRTSLIRHVLFDETLTYSEDQILNRVFFSEAAGPVVLAPQDWYTYYQNDFSALHAHRRWDQMEPWIRYWNCLSGLNVPEQAGALTCRFDKYLVNCFYQAVYEGILAGEKYSRTKLRRLLSLPAFQSARSNLSAADFRSFRSRMKFFFFRHSLTFPAYVLSVMFRFQNRHLEKTA